MDSTTQLQILPLALIMVMGPQILTAIFLTTSGRPVPNSIAMLIGVVAAASLSLLIWTGIVKLVGISPSGGESGPSTADYVVAGLLGLLALNVIRTRGTAETPKWMTTLQEAKPKRAFTLGFLLILLMPTDIVAVLSAANYLHDHHQHFYDGWPLVAAATLLMALPILAYVLLGQRAKRAMPGIRNWLTTHSWVVNLVVIVYFIYQLLSQ